MGVRSGSEAAEAGVEVWVCTRIEREEKERKGEEEEARLVLTRVKSRRASIEGRKKRFRDSTPPPPLAPFPVLISVCQLVSWSVGRSNGGLCHFVTQAAVLPCLFVQTRSDQIHI